MIISDPEAVQNLKLLQSLLVGGEAFPQTLLDKTREISPTKIYNVYGPTETTIWSTVKDVTGNGPLNIGKSIANTRIYILNDYRQQPDYLENRTLVKWHPDWHQGVLGIVASRMVETYYRPTVLIAIKGELGKGSARSIPGLNLYKALEACRDCLEDFGGHSMAAGLTIRAEHLMEFQRMFEKEVKRMAGPDDDAPRLTVDAEIIFDDISAKLLDEIEALSPFGTDNPEPVFMARNIKVVSSKIVGKYHRKMMLVNEERSSTKPVNAICFNAGDNLLKETAFARMAFRLRWNRWNDSKTIQLVVEDAQ